MGVHFAPPPPAAITRVLSRFDRDSLAAFVMVAIDLMDLADGDPDVEPNSDELDGNGSEDDFMDHGGDLTGAAGCPIADSGEDDDPAGGNVTDEPHDGEGDGDTFTTPMALVEQRDRIRRTRCVKHMSNYGGNRYATWRLRSDAPCGREVDHGE